MDDKIVSLQAENEAALSERDKLLEEKWKQRVSAVLVESVDY
jgi:hypothetical protein